MKNQYEQRVWARCVGGDGGPDRRGGAEDRGARVHALQGDARAAPALETFASKWTRVSSVTGSFEHVDMQIVCFIFEFRYFCIEPM